MALFQKSKPTDSYPGGHETHLFPCDCPNLADHFIRVDRDGDWWDANTFSVDWHWHPHGWWNRIKGAFKILRGEEHSYGEVILTQEVADEVIKALQGPYPKPE